MHGLKLQDEVADGDDGMCGISLFFQVWSHVGLGCGHTSRFTAACALIKNN
jgi:hypothetical protein